MSALLGKTVDGQFHIVERLGAGAMGAVYIAETTDGGEVALKVVLDGIADDLRAAQRFFREVKSLNKLEHPNIVQLIDFGRDESLHLSYLAMELARGDDVSKLTKMGRTSPDLAVHVARQAADGLALAHEQGVIHRDLKPANLMLCPAADGSVVVKVLDFGLAMLADADTRLTKTGTTPGTVSYMSPEQLLGNTIDAQTDIFALGIILYEMLSGRVPFRGQNQTEIALGVINRTPDPLHTVVPDCPRPVSDMVARMMQKEKGDRPESADDLVAELITVTRTCGFEPVRVSHVGPSQKPRAAWGLRPAVR